MGAIILFIAIFGLILVLIRAILKKQTVTKVIKLLTKMPTNAFLALVLFSLSSCDNSFENVDSEQNETYVEQEAPNEESRNSFDSQENSQGTDSEKMSFKDYLSSTSFSLNGNGNVYFVFNSYSNEGTITIEGNGNQLLGDCAVAESYLEIRNLKVISGPFDASNNNGSFGWFNLTDDGTLSGTLKDKNGNSRTIEFLPK